MSSDISKAIQFLCDEKGLNKETVLTALEMALAAAYRKDFGDKLQNILVDFDEVTGDMEVWDEKEVVEDLEPEEVERDAEILTARRDLAREERRELTEEEIADLKVFNPKNEIMLSEAKTHKKKSKVGDILKIDLEIPGEFGRMAAQTAKQVIIQKIREAERSNSFEEFKQNEGQVVQGVVHRRDRSGNILIDLGKIVGIVPTAEQVQRESYRPGAKMKFFVVSVEMGPRGPQIVLSRATNEMVKTVFEQEIPEIASGEVVIKGISRDPGFRAKVAVTTDEASIDPIGACIGQRGSRITTIIDELGGEKVDVIMWNDDAKEFIKNALSPAKISSIELNKEEKIAKAIVETDQFSLAIGRGGQNVRLASTLTGWQIEVEDINGENAGKLEGEEPETSSEDDFVAGESEDSEVSEEKLEATSVEETAEEVTEVSAEDVAEAEEAKADAEDKQEISEE